MRLFAVLLGATAAACSLYYSDHSDPMLPADAPVDACALPRLSSACVPDAFDALSPDGAWHMTGSATTTVYGTIGGSGSSTTSTIDQQVFIQRYGCVAGFGSAAMPVANPQTAVSPTGISLSCDHIAGCMRGQRQWSICVHADGQVVYDETAISTSTMPGAYETAYSASAVLTR